MFRIAQFGAILILLLFLSQAATGATLEFTPATTYAVGTGPTVVVIGDFNGDGKPDLAVANEGSANISILLGNGNGTFQPARNFADGQTPGGPATLAAGDFNGDAKLDLLVFGAGTAALCLGNGDGTFQPPTPIAGATSPSLFVADLNLDGKLDIISGSAVLLGNGDGTFQAPHDAGAGMVLLVDDLNDDGKPDLVTSTGSFPQIVLNTALGNGDGTFQAPVALPLPQCCNGGSTAGYSNPVGADFNGDSRLDLAVGETVSNCIDTCRVVGTQILVFLGNGDGTFQLGSAIDTDGSVIPTLLLSADFDGDGKTDIAAAPTILYGSSLIRFYLGQGDGTFPTTVDYEVGTGFINLAAEDLNGDKLPDIVSADPNDANISVVLSIAPDFAITPSSSTLTVSRGGQVTDTLALATEAGFEGTVALSCSVAGPAPTPTCGISPDSITPGQTATLTLTAGATRAELRPARFPAPLNKRFELGIDVGLIACFLGVGLNKNRRRMWLLCLLVAAATAFSIACGGSGGSGPGSGSQNYTVTVTGVSGSLHHAVNINVAVN